MDIYSVFSLIGGLAFFLFGMHIMSGGLEKVAGGKMESILRKMTSNPAKSLALGAIITIAIQSSSALTVMLIGLVNSGIMKIGQTVGVIMGSDIGTTLTAWILSLSGIESDNIFISMLKPKNFAPIVALIGVILLMAAKSRKKKDVGTILCGFAVLMYGMTLMSSSVAPLAESPEFRNLLVAFDNPLIGLLIGTAFTGIIQASAASIGVLQALALTGAINFGMAVPLVIGANIGTCVTAILGSIGVSRNAKRVPAIHIGIKIIGAVLWMVLYFILRYPVGLSLFERATRPVEIAVFHTIFNIGTVLILLPFSKAIVRAAERLIPVKEEVEQKKVLLDERLLLSPGLAVGKCMEKTREMAFLAQQSFMESIDVLHNYSEEQVARVVEMENRLDYMEDELDTFLIRLSQVELTDADSNAVSEMMHCINDFERIGDHAINMTDVATEMRRLGVDFSENAWRELDVLTDALREILDLAVGGFAQDDPAISAQVEPLEQVIDELTDEIKSRHISRLREGRCVAELGIPLSNLLINCERVSDHCSNVAISVIQTKNSSFETHGYLNELKNGQQPEFIRQFDNFREQYRLPESIHAGK